MTTQISHKFTSAKVDGPDATLVRPSNWNATHNPYLSMTNRSGSATAQFDCCAVGTANDDSFTKTTTLGDTRPLVVVQDAAGIADGAAGNVQHLFETTVNVQGNVVRGNWMQFSATAGRLADTGVAGTSPAPGGVVAIAVTGYAGGGAGTLTALLRGSTSTGIASLFRQVTTIAFNNTAAEQILFTTSIPANTLSTNRMVRLTAWGEFLNNRGGNTVYTFQLYYGATVIATGAFTAISAATSGGWAVHSELAGANATGAQVATTRVTLSDNTLGLGNAGTLRSTTALDKIGSHDSVAEDSTASKTYKLTITMDTADVNSTCTITNAQAELI